MAQNIIYSPWERTKGPELGLMTTLLLFSLHWLFSFVWAFLTSLIKLILWLKFSRGKRQAKDMVGRARIIVLLCFMSNEPDLSHFQMKWQSLTVTVQSSWGLNKWQALGFYQQQLSNFHKLSTNLMENSKVESHHRLILLILTILKALTIIWGHSSIRKIPSHHLPCYNQASSSLLSPAVI